MYNAKLRTTKMKSKAYQWQKETNLLGMISSKPYGRIYFQDLNI